MRYCGYEEGAGEGGGARGLITAVLCAVDRVLRRPGLCERRVGQVRGAAGGAGEGPSADTDGLENNIKLKVTPNRRKFRDIALCG